MKIDSLIHAKLVKRYKRFLADVIMEDGSELTAHCPNSGRMTGCVGENWPVLLSKSENTKRKYSHTLEMTHNGKTWIVVNTNRANEAAFEAVEYKQIKELLGYDTFTREVKYGKNSRIDILCESADKKCYVEVKSVTLVMDDGCYAFPDAPTERGRKHLQELMGMVDQGHRAVMLYIILREDGLGFRPAKEIDPKYAEQLQIAIDHGVEAYAYKMSISENSITMDHSEQIIL